MASSRDEKWERVRGLENLLALLDGIDERRRVIREQAWHEGSFDAIFEEATAMRDDLARLKAQLSERWETLMEEARGEQG
jgi:hypothetical protein